MQLLETLIKSGASLGVFVLLFLFYFRHFVFKRSPILQSRAFFLGLLSASLTLLLQQALHQILPRPQAAWIEAFFFASATEEIVRFAFIYYLIRRSSEIFTATEGVFDGILIGLGFAVAENIYYGAAYPGYVILLRSLTCIPLHAFLSGIMAWHISMALLSDRSFLNLAANSNGGAPVHYSSSSRRRYLRAFAGPFALHGIYDWLLLSGGPMVYLLGPLLIYCFLRLEFALAHGNVQFGRNVLEMIGIDAQDLDVALAQREYEKRLDEIQEQDDAPDALFRWQWPLWSTLAAIAFLTLAAGSLLFQSSFSAGVALLSAELYRALFAVFPATAGTILLLSGKLNYLYFRDLMLRTPRICGAGLSRKGKEEQTISLFDLRPSGVFLSGIDDLKAGERVLLRFGDRRGHERDGLPGRWSEIGIRARITWSNTNNRSLPVGFVCRYESISLRFWAYRLHYQFQKLWRRLHEMRDEVARP